MEWRHHDGGRAAAGFRGKASDCVTRAIAIATGRPYAQVYADLTACEAAQRRRRLKRGSARTGINKDIIRAYMTSLGWRFVSTMGIGTGCTVHLRDGEIPMRGPVIVSVSRHLCAVVDGVVYDTHDPTRGGRRCVYGLFLPPEAV